jgi:hypothetical protein
MFDHARKHIAQYVKQIIKQEHKEWVQKYFERLDKFFLEKKNIRHKTMVQV